MKHKNAIEIRRNLKFIRDALASGNWTPNEQSMTYLNYISKKLTEAGPTLRPLEVDMVRYLYWDAIGTIGKGGE